MKKQNPQDTTLRNSRAHGKRLWMLERRMRFVERDIKSLAKIIWPRRGRPIKGQD